MTRVAAAAVIVLALVILWTPFSQVFSPKPTRVWRGYDTLLVRAAGPADARLASALDGLGPGVISESTTTVDFYDFGSSARVRLAELPRRLDPLDPRRDPYIDRLEGYFSVTSGEVDTHVVYIPARWSALRVFIVLSRALGPAGRTGWRLVEFDPAEKVLSVMTVLAFAALLAPSARRKKRGQLPLAMACSAAWIPAVLAGGPAVLALSLLLLFLWIPLLRARFAVVVPAALPARLRKPFLACTGIAVASIAVFSLANAASPGETLIVAAPLACTVLAFFCAPVFQSLGHDWRKSRVFTPVPILTRGNEDGRGRQRALSLALLCTAVVVLVPLLRGGAFPAPRALPGAPDFSWDAVARLRERPAIDRLPDFSDLVGHEAYQQTLGFGRQWHVPARDERVYRHQYLVDTATGAVSGRLVTVKTFDSTWLASVASRREPGTIEALLASQGRPVAVAVRGPARALARELPFTALAFLALVAFLCRDLRLGLLIRGNLWRINGEARRDQVP